MVRILAIPSLLVEIINVRKTNNGEMTEANEAKNDEGKTTKQLKNETVMAWRLT